MALEKLVPTAIVVIILAVIVMAGVAMFTQWSLAVRINTGAEASGITLTNQTAVAVGTTGQFPFLQTASPCFNETDVADVVPAAGLSIATGDADGGTITLDANTAALAAFDGTDVNCTITYLADSDGQSNADLFVTGLGIFGTFMAVIVLALVGMIIIGLFRNKNDD